MFSPSHSGSIIYLPASKYFWHRICKSWMLWKGECFWLFSPFHTRSIPSFICQHQNLLKENLDWFCERGELRNGLHPFNFLQEAGQSRPVLERQEVVGSITLNWEKKETFYCFIFKNWLTLGEWKRWERLSEVKICDHELFWHHRILPVIELAQIRISALNCWI